MTHKQRVIGVVCLALAVGAFASVADAGFKNAINTNQAEVWKNNFNVVTYAEGSLSDTRFSSDSNRWIYCGAQGYYNNATSVYCGAYDGVDSAYCYSPDAPGQAGAVASINEDSYIRFKPRSDGACEYIVIENKSNIRPKLSTWQ